MWATLPFPDKPSKQGVSLLGDASDNLCGDGTALQMASTGG